jgi:uncharacterized delta-60 repeat protein
VLEVTAAPGSAFKPGGRARLVTHAADEAFQAIWMGPGIDKVAVPLTLEANGVATVSIPAGLQGRLATLTLARLPAGADVETATDYSSTRTVAFSFDGGTHAPGTVDTSFGQKGVAILVRADTYIEGKVGVVQPDGKIVVGGVDPTAYESRDVGFLARFHADGTPDLGFGTDGILVLTTTYTVVDVAVQSDGKLIVFDGSVLMRLNPNGTLDTTYGDQGTTKQAVWFGSGGYGRLKVQPDDKVLLALSPALYRIKTDGTPDLGFGTSGRVYLAPTGDPHSVYDHRKVTSVDVLPDGRILAAGAVRPAGDFNVAVARFTPSGAFDTSFGVGGLFTTDLYDAYEYVWAVKATVDGGAVALFETNEDIATGNKVFNVGLLKLTPSGTLDPTFSQDGIVLNERTAPSELARTLVQQLEGMWVMAGTQSGMTRFTADGVLDTAFTPGRPVMPATVDPRSTAVANHLVAQPDGRILATGYLYGPWREKWMAVVRYWH